MPGQCQVRDHANLQDFEVSAIIMYYSFAQLENVRMLFLFPVACQHILLLMNLLLFHSDDQNHNCS